MSTTSLLRENPATEILVAKARTGSQSAWKALYQRYRVMLIAQVRSRIPGFARRRFDAEDVLQQAVIKAWEEFNSFEYRGEGSLRRWLATLVVNEFQNLLRAQRAEQDRVHRDPASKALEHIADGDTDLEGQRAGILEALGTLDELDRDVLIQYVFEEQSLEAIAAAQGCSREKARQLYIRASDRLLRQLQP